MSAAELWLGLLFVLVLAAGFRLHAAWLPRLVVASAVLALLGLAGLNPDRFIADRNIDRYACPGTTPAGRLASQRGPKLRVRSQRDRPGWGAPGLTTWARRPDCLE